MEVPEPVVDETSRALDVTSEGGVGGTIRVLRNMPGLWLLQESKGQWKREGCVYSWEETMHLAARAEPFMSLIDPDAPGFQRPADLPALILGDIAAGRRAVAASVTRRTYEPSPDAAGWAQAFERFESLLERNLPA